MAKEEWEDEELDEEEEEFDVASMFKENIKRLFEERKKYPAMSEQYMVLTQRISEETENMRNAEEAKNELAQRDCALRNKNTVLWQSLASMAGSIAGNTINALFNRKNVKTVVNYEEDGGIVNSKALKFVK